MGDEDKKPAFKVSFGGAGKKGPSAHALAAKARKEQEDKQAARDASGGSGEGDGKGKGKGGKGKGGKGKGKGGGKGEGGDGGKGKGKGKGMIQGQAWLTGGSAVESVERVRTNFSTKPGSSSGSSSLSAAVKPEDMDVDLTGADGADAAAAASAAAAAGGKAAQSAAKEEEFDPEAPGRGRRGDGDYEEGDRLQARDPWAPVQVPYGLPTPSAPAGGAPVQASSSSSSKANAAASRLFASGEAVDEAAEEADLIFLQLPTTLPPLRRDRLRVDRPGGVAAQILGPALPPPAGPKSVPGGGAAAVGPVSSASRAAANALQALSVPAGAGDHKQGALGELGAGFFGTIQVHASGRCVLLLGGSSYDLEPGAATAFAQQVVTVRTGGHPITKAAARAAESAAAASGSAAAAAFKHEDGGSDSDGGGGGMGGGGGGGSRGGGVADMGPSSSAAGSSSQAAAAAAAAAKAKAEFARMAASGPRAFTVLGPVTKRLLAVPTLATLLGTPAPLESEVDFI